MYGTMDNLVAYKMLIQQTQNHSPCKDSSVLEGKFVFTTLDGKTLGLTREELFYTIQGRENIA